MILRVGLTGGIASGKSTIAGYFADLGCHVIDADGLVADLYRPNHPGYQAIVRTYGREILRPDDEIDRTRLADIAFASSESARQLGQLIHPLVMAECDRLIADRGAQLGRADEIVVVEATLLLEAGGRSRFDKIVVVDVDPETQISRGIARGMAGDEVVRRIDYQLPRGQRLLAADYVISNRGAPAEARSDTWIVFEKLVAALRSSKTAAESPEP